ncbi:MAG TPA: ubiquinol-cytochrome c reductase iron-sulfur subunit [Nitrospiria bacterium]|jgi:Rieske Fe-S protein
MSIKIKFKVRCGDEEVGEISRVIADPITKNISHIVVRGRSQEWVVPFNLVAVEGEHAVLSCSSSEFSNFPKLKRENFVQLSEVEIAGLERRMEEVSPGETLVPLPELEKDLSRRSFFMKFTHAIGVVIALPLVYPIIRYLIHPLYQPFNNSWFTVARAQQFPETDVPKLVHFEREIKEGYLVRKFKKSHWVVRTSDNLKEKVINLREKLYGSKALEFHGTDGKVIWENDADSEFTVFSGKCPHLGCAYRWKENHKRFGRVFWCPCHLSIYGPDGEVLDGPAPRPLDIMPTKVSPGGTVEVIDAEYKAGRTHVIRIL